VISISILSFFRLAGVLVGGKEGTALPLFPLLLATITLSTDIINPYVLFFHPLFTSVGIDKADVRFVVHWDPPASLEGLYQEAGRAGRDGLPSHSLIYASQKELREMGRLEKGQRAGATAAVIAYCTEAKCRRRALLAHFEEKRGACDAVVEACCDYCLAPGEVARQLARLDSVLASAAGPVEGEGEETDDPYERCAPGSGTEEEERVLAATKKKGSASDNEDEDSDVGSEENLVKVPPQNSVLLCTAKQLDAGGILSGPLEGLKPGLRRGATYVAPRLRFTKPAAMSLEVPAGNGSLQAGAATGDDAASGRSPAAAVPPPPPMVGGLPFKKPRRGGFQPPRRVVTES
jgi:hypothetical protein